MSNKSEIQDNNAELRAILDEINALSKLPILANPATEDKVLEGYEFVDGKGLKVTGTLTLEQIKSTIPKAEEAKF